MQKGIKFEDFIKDNEYGKKYIDIFVYSKKEQLLHICIMQRPLFCNRGKFLASLQKIKYGKSNGDIWPRFFFRLETALRECHEYIKCRDFLINEKITYEISEFSEEKHKEVLLYEFTNIDDLLKKAEQEKVFNPSFLSYKE